MEMRCYCSYPSKPASTRSRVVLDPLRVQFTVIQFQYTIYPDHGVPEVRFFFPNNGWIVNTDRFILALLYECFFFFFYIYDEWKVSEF